MIELIKQFLEAKEIEQKATRYRVKLGERITQKLEHPDEGSKTHTIKNYKVTVKSVINRKVDWKIFDQIELKNPPVKIKRELDVVGLKWYQENDPISYKKLCEAIIATPGRSQIEIKEVENDV